jgi:hypothetical protein
MTDMLQEFCDSRGVAVRVDRQSGVIRGVKVLGLVSRNGRSYLPEALAQAAPLYEDAKVNVNHPKGNPHGPRDYQDRIGTIRGVAVRAGEGLFGDFHFNPKHALAEQLIWDAEHAPENVGFSHNVEARVGRRDGQPVVEAIVRVQSVDLVADPATTRGLFEAESESPHPGPLPKGEGTLVCPRAGLFPVGEGTAAEVERLRAEVERLTALEAVHQKQAAARRLLHEFALPEPDAADRRSQAVVGPQFMASLLAAPDETAMRALVEERARLGRQLTAAAGAQDLAEVQPQSRDQHLVYAGGAAVAKSFVEAIT